MRSVTIDLAVYSLAVVLQACHPFVGRCYVHVRSGEGGTGIIEFAPRDPDDSLRDVPGEFAHALLDAHLRLLLRTTNPG